MLIFNDRFVQTYNCGHLGFGSVHARPFFKPKEGDLIEQIMTVSEESFRVLQKYKGTLVGEHNSGRSRSIYLEKELGPAYKYLRMIKLLFDPEPLDFHSVSI